MASPATEAAYIRWFDQLGLDDVPLVGGKNASLGELSCELMPHGVKVPPGFAVTAESYRAFLRAAGLDEQIRSILADLDTRDITNLRQRGRRVRQAMLAAPLPVELEDAILAAQKVRDDMGLTNLKLMIPFCRTVEEGRKVLAEMVPHGLQRGVNGLEVYVMCEIPSKVILAGAFADLFDGFSIGSNDLTQLILGVDRDSEIIAHIFDERDPAVMRMIAEVIRTVKAKGRKIGICGQAPSDYPEFVQFLVEQGIDSISLNPDAVLKTTLAIADMEHKLNRT